MVRHGSVSSVKRYFARPTAIVDTIVAPLSALGVHLVSHVLVEPNGTYAGIVTGNNCIRKCWLNNACYKQFGVMGDFAALSECLSISRVEDFANNIPDKMQNNLISCFIKENYKYQIYLAVKTKELFETFWFVIDSRYNYSTVLAIYKKIYHFILYYKEKIVYDYELQQIYDNPQYRSSYRKNVIKITSSRNFMNAIKYSSFYFPGFIGNKYLSVQQLKCFRSMFVDQYTARQTAALLNLSHRTVERHLNMMRKKFVDGVADLLCQLVHVKDLL